jgi:Na+(H+)/acetate symporter ActP
MEEEDSQQSRTTSLAAFGSSIALGSAVLILGGYWLDQRAGGGYSRTLVGLLLALLYIVYETWKLTRQLAAGNRDKSKPGDHPQSASQNTPAP